MTEETTTHPLAEIRAAHMLCTHSTPRPGGVNIHKAGCSCGARYDWYRREVEHVEHVDAVIVARMDARVAHVLEQAAQWFSREDVEAFGTTTEHARAYVVAVLADESMRPGGPKFATTGEQS